MASPTAYRMAFAREPPRYLGGATSPAVAAAQQQAMARILRRSEPGARSAAELMAEFPDMPCAGMVWCLGVFETALICFGSLLSTLEQLCVACSGLGSGALAAGAGAAQSC